MGYERLCICVIGYDGEICVRFGIGGPPMPKCPPISWQVRFGSKITMRLYSM